MPFVPTISQPFRVIHRGETKQMPFRLIVFYLNFKFCYVHYHTFLQKIKHKNGETILKRDCRNDYQESNEEKRR